MDPTREKEIKLQEAGKMVLQSYGQFLDHLDVQFFNLRQDFISYDSLLVKPIEVEVLHMEHSSVYEKVNTDNSIYNKILIVFSVISKEIKDLKKELLYNFLQKIMHYGINNEDKMDIETCISQVCEMLPTLFDLLNFVHRCQDVLEHFLQQLTSSFKHHWNNAQITNHFQFMELFSSLGDLLLIFVTLDVVFETYNDNMIYEHLSHLEKYLQKNENYSPNIDTLKRVMLEIQNGLLGGNIFQESINMNSDKRYALSQCIPLKNHLNIYLRNKLLEIENTKDYDLYSLQAWSNILVNYVFSLNIFGVSDKRIQKQIAEFSKKLSVLPLFGDVLWLPYKFLVKHLESKVKEPMCKLISHDMLIRYLETSETNLPKDIRNFAIKVCKWSLQMENIMVPDAAQRSKCNDMDVANLCLVGLNLAWQMHYMMNYISYLYSLLQKPMTKAVALNLSKFIELNNAVKSVFTRHHIIIHRRLNHVLQRLLIQCLSIITKFKKDTIKSKNNLDSEIDSYSAMVLAEKLMYGPCTEETLLLTHLVLTLSNPNQAIYTEAGSLMPKLLRNLHTFIQLNNVIEESTKCSSILTEGIFHVYFKNLMNQPSISRMQYIVDNTIDEKELEKGQPELKLVRELKTAIKTDVIEKLSNEMETYLRIHAHSHLNKDATYPTSKDLKTLLKVPTLVISNEFTTIKGCIESYLDKTFYDLATVALHDWQTYREMRCLAEHTFKLALIEDHLPSQTLSQGLDILEIMRNIHVFVCKYLYNLNNQCFIEMSSTNKHLNTIRIPQIANSLCTHGTGIMNTTTNFVYQFLKKKMVVFSQFLFDENISSRLQKDLLFFNAIKSNHNSYYPYERAEKFNKNIARLGAFGDGQTFLDQYRSLITQIGNALGFVRMVRTGGLHQCLKEASCLPSKSISINKINLENYGIETLDSFDHIIFNINHNLDEGTEYLKLLVHVFSTLFNSPENNHLKLFSIIIPPLTINFVNYIVKEKEKMLKRNKDGTVFTDDGFAIGIAYLLAVLNLKNEFDSLRWFYAVNKKYEDEINKISNVNAQHKDTHENTIKLSVRKLQMYKQEFEFFYYNLNSARTFFENC